MATRTTAGRALAATLAASAMTLVACSASPSALSSPSALPSATRPSKVPLATPSRPPLSSAKALVSLVRSGRPVPVSGYERGAASLGQQTWPTPNSAEFTTPSGNIACGITVAGAAEVSCAVTGPDYPPPHKPRNCHLNFAPGWLNLTARNVTRGQCLGGLPFPPVSHLLPYGYSIQLGQMSCRSDAA
jgi:hypothetical protein